MLNRSIDALVNRGTPLERGADEGQLEYLEQSLSISLGQEFKEVYLAFNGFEKADIASLMWVWDINKIVSHGGRFSAELRRGIKWLTIGDFLIESDFIAVSAEENKSQVILLHEGRIISDSISKFLEDMVAGKFDI